MIESAVIKLQLIAADQEKKLPDVLRMTLLLARKLGRSDMASWAERELNGYENEDDVPEYRKVRARLLALNPQVGPIPIFLEPQEFQDLLERTFIMQPIASLESVAASGKPGQIPFDKYQYELLWGAVGGDMKMSAYREIASTSIVGILDRVRTAAMEWGILLEREGVLGEGMTFTQTEKARAQSIHIQNFQGVLGDHASVQDSFNTTLAGVNLDTLVPFMVERGIDQEDAEELQKAMVADGAPALPHAFGDRVNAWLTRMYVKVSSGVETLAPEVTKEFLVAAIMKAYDSLR